MNRSYARSKIYDILSICFTYPDEKISSWIRRGEWIEELEDCLNLLAEEDFKAYLQPIKDLLAARKENFSLELAREYTRLFINAVPHVVAPPYGSVYMEKDGLVFGKTTSEVLRFYHERGFTLKEDLADLPDHIAHKLEFMGILTDREARVSGNEKVQLEELQMAFLSHFLLPWVPTFCERVIEHSRSPFYRFLAELTSEFFNLERNYLGIPEELNQDKNVESETIGGKRWQSDMS